MKILLSVITPTFNEEDSIVFCIRKLREVMGNYDKDFEYEHIIIDNSSKDQTVKFAVTEAVKDPRVKVIVNSRNIGASRNIYRALSKTSGDWVVPMLPADLQDPAEIIPIMLEARDKDTQIVYGIRANREESKILRLIRKVYYRILSKMSHFELENDAGEFALISRSVVESILAVKDENPYIRGLIAQTGAKHSSIQYDWKRRANGKSKSSLLVLIDVAINGMVSTTQIPARIALIGGLGVSFLSLIVGLFYTILALASPHVAPPGIPTLIVSIFFIGGIQLFFLGLIGEYVLSLHRQIKPEVSVFSSFEYNFESN